MGVKSQNLCYYHNPKETDIEHDALMLTADTPIERLSKCELYILPHCTIISDQIKFTLLGICFTRAMQHRLLFEIPQHSDNMARYAC